MEHKLTLVILLVVALVSIPLSVRCTEDEDLYDDFGEEDATDAEKMLELYLRLSAQVEERYENQKRVKEILQFLDYYNRTYTDFMQRVEILDWNYETNATAENAGPYNDLKVRIQAWKLKQAGKAQNMNVTGLNKKQKRLVKLIRETAACKEKTERNALAFTISKMKSIYAQAQVTLNNGKTFVPGESEISAFFKSSSDYDQLAEAWKKWRDVSGKKLKKLFTRMVTLLNKGATENGYSDYGFYDWYTDFEDLKFNEMVMDLYREVLPLYKELHAYVRYKLSLRYPNRFDPKGPIPAHILGNLWAQQWTGIFKFVKPYEKASSIDVTATMKAQNWTVCCMFKDAEKFFKSIGLFNMTEKFWKRSMFKNPGDRPVECHASAWDFYTLDDFRIKMCTKVNQDYFTTIHHEMGHIIYFMSYRYQPVEFRSGANSGFHEAIGDTIALSVSTTKHLHKIGLLKESTTSKETEINALIDMALQKIAFLPFGLLVDSWRWRVYNSSVSERDYNKEWWRLRKELQGIEPPVPPSDDDFDPGAKYHVAANVPYIRYFVSFIMQFQFYEAMCKKSGHKGPIHQCDFYESKAAGHLLKSMLELGKSQPWPEAMKLMTGQTKISLASLLNYFDPLHDWLKKERAEKGYPIGWKR